MGSKKSNDKTKKEKLKKESDIIGNADDRRSKNGGKIITDARFSSVHSDPRFQKVPKHKTKVEIDSRFKRMFRDKSFNSSSAPLDKRGKPKKDRSGNALSHYYRLEEEEDQKNKVGNEEDEDGVDEENKNVARNLSDSESNSELEVSGAEYDSGSDTSSSGSDTDEEDDQVYSEEELPVQEENIPVIEKETHRLAIVNMEWRQVKAVDLFMVLSSFLPKGGHINSVAVYPSEFGLKRMEEEAIHGPVDLFDDEEQSDDDDDDNEIDEVKLRAYEKSQLSYYYAVVDCDSIATADYLYKACDGIEFERSSNVLDLRFIPDTMEFTHPPRDIATEAPAKYEGLDFHTRALQHSKIHISWDEDDPQRAKTMKRKYNDDEQAELAMKEYLASDTDENGTDDNEPDLSDKEHKKQNKYLALLEPGDGSDRDCEEDDLDMEVTFNTGLEDISKRILEKKDKKSETVWEAYLRKRSEKRKNRKNRSKYSSEDESDDSDQEQIEQPGDFFVEEQPAEGTDEAAQSKKDKKKKKLRQETNNEGEVSRAELELLLADEEGADTGVKGYNLKCKKSKGKKGKEAVDEAKIPAVDYDDPRFSSLFTSPLFALDPTDPQFKRSAAYVRQLAQKQGQKGDGDELMRGKEAKKLQQKRAQPLSEVPEANKKELSMADELPSKREKQELSSLVRSIKTKSKQVKMPSNGKVPRESENMHLNVEDKGREHDISSLVRSVKKKARVVQKFDFSEAQ